jgi:hypothetical protein
MDRFIKRKISFLTLGLGLVVFSGCGSSGSDDQKDADNGTAGDGTALLSVVGSCINRENGVIFGCQTYRGSHDDAEGECEPLGDLNYSDEWVPDEPCPTENAVGKCLAYNTMGRQLENYYYQTSSGVELSKQSCGSWTDL